MWDRYIVSRLNDSAGFIRKGNLTVIQKKKKLLKEKIIVIQMFFVISSQSAKETVIDLPPTGRLAPKS